MRDTKKTRAKRPSSSRAGRRFFSLPFHESEHVTVGIAPSRAEAYRVVILTHAQGKAARVKEALVVEPSGDSGEKTASFSKVKPDVPVVLAMPRSEVLVRTVRVPSSDPRQIAQMMPHEATGHLPWPSEESEVGYEVQGADSEGYTTVLLFMAKKSSVREHLTRLAACGIRPTRVEVSVLSAARVLASSADEERPAMLILGREEQTYVRLSNGGHAFSRGVSGKQEPAGMLHQTIELDGRRNGPRGRFTSLVVAGEREADLDDLARVAGSTASVLSAEEARFACLNGTGPLAACDVVPVGAALGAYGQASANLLPKRETRTLALKQAFRQGRTFALLAGWLAAVLFGIAYHSFQGETARAERAEQAIVALEEEVGDLRAQSEALKLLAGERRLVRVPLRLVLELYERTPQAVAINSMQYNARGTLVFRGESSSFPVVLQYIDDLSHSPLLRKVELVYITRPQGATGESLVEFKVTGEVKGKG